MITYIISALVTFFGLLIGIPIFLGILKFFGVYVIVKERQSVVYVLFGNVVGQINEPGIHLLWFKLGLWALVINWLGKRYWVDMRLDQEYLRSQPVNSEEGAPMGIGIWYEMYISDPLAFIFRNTDPRGSLSANVGNSTVRCLSNMPLERMMIDRHAMSQAVRAEVSPKSHEWGYRLGSSYVRKVHFRDAEMIRQIESKVVNRLRQVTSAIKQDGTNQVNIIRSTAERTAAVDFGKAAAIRPKIVGEALQQIAKDPVVAATMFEILETERILNSNAPIEMVPAGNELLAQLLAAQGLPIYAEGKETLKKPDSK
ncbi:MAG TPA: SPFH domain-containing protein [Bacillota bacterium]|nr:SPFH domain-containing protein [Bacillota bacterium]